MNTRFPFSKELSLAGIALLSITFLVSVFGAAASKRGWTERGSRIELRDKLTVKQESEKRERKDAELLLPLPIS